MGKVSIGLRGWRFDEADVFSEEDELRPLSEMPPDVRKRIQRLSTVVSAPCDVCWLHQESATECRVAEVVYGEPGAEVLLCDEHETDFVYWYREAGGQAHRGTAALQDRFHEWIASGNSAPNWYDGIEHIATNPTAVPEAKVVDLSTIDPELPDEQKERIDLRNMEIRHGEDAERDDRDESKPDDTQSPDVDLSRDYPT